MGDAQPGFWKKKGKLLAYSKKCDVEHPIIGKQMSKITKKSLLLGTWKRTKAVIQKPIRSTQGWSHELWSMRALDMKPGAKEQRGL